MRAKNIVYASQGSLDPSLTDNDYATGMVAGTVAMAEDVNTFGNRSDVQLKVVSDEICNAITDNGIALDNNNNAQLSAVLGTKMGTAGLQTGIDYDSYTTAPTLSNGVITFPAITVWFNSKVFYGKGKSDFDVVQVSQQTLEATSSWADGVYYAYVDTTGTIQKQDTPVLASDGDEKCYLGSFFVYGGSIQTGSWNFEPWLQQTSVSTRTTPTAQTKGGLILPKNATQLTMGALQIKQEGINFGVDPFDPNVKSLSAVSTFEYKYLYPGYNPGSSAVNTLDTTHLYNMTSGTWDDITGTNGFIVIVPCVVSTGQTLLIPAMSYKSGTTYSQVFPTQKEAENALFSLPYDLGNVAKRAIYLNQAFIVKVGATDLTDPEQFEVYGVVPQELAGFSDQGGQTGGGTGGFVPMNEVVWNQSSVTLLNQASNIITASSVNTINLSFPATAAGKLNQLEIKFTPNSALVPGISFPANIKWYDDEAPVIVAGYTYNFIFEYNRLLNKWTGGFFSTSV